MPKKTIVLRDNDIERIINGEEISVKINDEEIIIRQSYMKDAAAPIINRDNKIFSENEMDNIKRAQRMLGASMKLGC